MKKFVALLLVLALALSLTACATKSVNNLTNDFSPKKVSEKADLNGSARIEVTDFGLSLLGQAYQSGKNSLISPLSIIAALGMTANGADGETLSQMENAFGLSAPELSLFIHDFSKTLPNKDKCKISLANSIWFNSSKEFSVETDFLQKTVDFYGAEIYQVPFKSGTEKLINNWVSDKTDKMIDEILNETDPMTMMVLVNALAFDAEWEDPYESYQVNNTVFTKEDGTQLVVEMMFSSYEPYEYIEASNSIGFIKDYKDGDYAFAALLPNEGISLGDYIAQLDGEKLVSILDGSRKDVYIKTGLPKFEAEFSAELSPMLKAMGMTNAFSAQNADFSLLGKHYRENIYIGNVQHKTYISVNEQGTKAAAATAVEAPAGDSAEEPIMVILNRPFLYMIIDRQTGLPVFIGAMNDIKA